MTRTELNRLYELRDVAIKLMQMGYYDIFDYYRFCEANKIKLF